jgi:hypothetical protein
MTKEIIEAETKKFFRTEFIEMLSAIITTRKNHILITVFHLYFIRKNISANASIKENIIDKRLGDSEVSSPNGRGFSISISLVVPFAGSTITWVVEK